MKSVFCYDKFVLPSHMFPHKPPLCTKNFNFSQKIHFRNCSCIFFQDVQSNGPTEGRTFFIFDAIIFYAVGWLVVSYFTIYFITLYVGPWLLGLQYKTRPILKKSDPHSIMEVSQNIIHFSKKSFQQS